MTVLHPTIKIPPDAELPPWTTDASCREETSAAFFFPGGDRGQTLAMTNAAKKVCGGCPVRVDCLLYATETEQEYGVWGGATEPEHRRLRRKLRTAKSSQAAIDALMSF